MSETAPQTFAALGIQLKANGRAQQRVRCPKCGKSDRDDTLGVNRNLGVFRCFRCGLKGRVGGECTVPASVSRIDDPAVRERKRDRLRRIWSESVPLDDVKRAYAVRTYLESRALGQILDAPPPALRAHPAFEYWDQGRSLGRFPAMVAQITGRTGEMVSLHVTCLHSSGRAKADVPRAKKMMPPPVPGATAGGAIRLYEPSEGALGVAEGIESALSLHLLRERIPVWCGLCADNLPRLQLPTLRALVIGVDIDASGIGFKAAEKLAARTRQWSLRTKVTFCLPDIDGVSDLNDELRHRHA